MAVEQELKSPSNQVGVEVEGRFCSSRELSTRLNSPSTCLTLFSLPGNGIN